jgi:heme/copper-type cytochrome/quinol oxidase subunit 4
VQIWYKKNFQFHKFKRKFEGKGTFDGKNKVSQSTNFKNKKCKTKGPAATFVVILIIGLLAFLIYMKKCQQENTVIPLMLLLVILR